jgi:GH15 family glucan-1,4-alpha-glucosidase
MAWVAFDRAVKAVERFGLEGPVDRWRKILAAIHDEVCQKGFSTDRNSFVQYYGADYPDASLLLMPLVGFLPATDSRIRGTVAAIEHDLMHKGFIHRYPTKPDVDGLPTGEGAFLACTFWYIDNLILQGRQAEAEELFARLLGVCNDVGLLSEEYDADAKRLVGNFPQAFSHVALVNCARNLSHAGGPAHVRQHARLA